MGNIDPKMYQKYFIIDKGLKVLYPRMKKGLYGLLYIALLFYPKLATDLKNDDLILNIYDPCVKKKLLNGDIMTVVWHVVDLKVSLKDQFEVTKFATYLSTIYGKELTVHRGKVNYYLGCVFGIIRSRYGRVINDQVSKESCRQITRNIDR